MSKDRPSMRGRGEEILGRGVDALFSSPPAEKKPPPPATAAAPAPPPPAVTDEVLDELLEAEAHDATHGVDIPAETAAAPPPPPARHEPSPISRTPAAAARPQPPTPSRPTLASAGVLIPDDELLDRIDVPLASGDPSPPSPFDERADTSPQEEAPAPTGPRLSEDLRPRDEPGAPPSPLPPAPTPAPTPAPVRPEPPAPAQPEPVRTQPVSAEPEPPVPPSRPRVDIGGRLTEVALTEEDEEDIRPQSPFIRAVQPVNEDLTPRTPRSPEERARILSQVQQERIDELHNQIDRLYRDIPKRISNRPDLAAQAMGMLRQSRTILYEKPYDFVEAEFKVQQALTLYNRIENSEKWADSYGWRVFWFEVIVFFVFLVTFLGLLAFGEEFSLAISRVLGIDTPGQGVFTAVGFWATFVWGGIGGVVGAMYILWMHVSERQDFERQHVMWYIAQPIMGLILGGVIFLIINTGLLSLQGGTVAAQQLRTEVQLFPALLAFIAGFRPQFLFGLLIKVIKVINPSDETS